MSDTMLFAVLRMPIDCWGYDPFDQAQRHSRYVQAANEIERLQAEVKRLRGDHIACHHGRDIIASLAQAIYELPCCGMTGILGAAIQEIDALRNVIAEGGVEVKF